MDVFPKCFSIGYIIFTICLYIKNKFFSLAGTSLSFDIFQMCCTFPCNFPADSSLIVPGQTSCSGANKRREQT